MTMRHGDAWDTPDLGALRAKQRQRLAALHDAPRRSARSYVAGEPLADDRPAEWALRQTAEREAEVVEGFFAECLANFEAEKTRARRSVWFG
jgi:hypothetical protein